MDRLLFKDLRALANMDKFPDLGEPGPYETVPSKGLRVMVTPVQINLARRIVKNIFGVNPLTAGGSFLDNALSFYLAHMTIVAKSVKEPYSNLVRRFVDECKKNKATYKRIATLVDKIPVD